MAAPTEAVYPLIDNAEPEENHGYDYDLIVIGGGSGGLALAQEAAKYGRKIAVIDFVRPTPLGTTWGLGGTCVNVGCIPKKLMHTAALLGESLKDSREYGWETPTEVKHNWTKMVEAVQDHIGSLNWGYRSSLREKNVEYINAQAVFIDPHTIECTNRAKKVTQHTARRFVIAVGGRPKYLDIPGAQEHCITSDDLFSLDHPPGKSLVVGASYVALECAGFLRGVGFDTTVMARSIFLRGFDQQCAEMISEYMGNHGTQFLRPAVPTKIEKIEDENNANNGRLMVHYTLSENSQSSSDVFDTVLLAVGRRPETDHLGLDKAKVYYDKADGKIPVINERTNVSHIYALGDVIKGDLELTPVAIMAGRLLARRLYNRSTLLMDYVNIPTTVFTPIEYGAVGYPEENAEKLFGKDNIEVYHCFFTPLEWTVSHREDNICYIKCIVNKADKNRVIGLHVLGPNAGEVIQGFAAAIKAGITKEILDNTIGIHPTCAEEVTGLTITKSSGVEAKKKGC